MAVSYIMCYDNLLVKMRNVFTLPKVKKKQPLYVAVSLCAKKSNDQSCRCARHSSSAQISVVGNTTIRRKINIQIKSSKLPKQKINHGDHAKAANAPHLR